MTNRLSSKHKISRRLGVDIWGTSKSPVNKRAYKPGERHEGIERKPSNYGLQLSEKQKLRGHYGTIGEKQFKKTFVEALRRKGDTGKIFASLLERRLDAVVYRLKMAPTIFAARQIVGHGHILINGKKVDRPSCLVKVGDQIELHEKSKNMAIIHAAIASKERDIPSYFKFDTKHIKGELVSEPKFEDIPYPMQVNLNLIVELYSKVL